MKIILLLFISFIYVTSVNKKWGSLCDYRLKKISEKCKTDNECRSKKCVDNLCVMGIKREEERCKCDEECDIGYYCPFKTFHLDRCLKLADNAPTFDQRIRADKKQDK